MKHFYAFLFTYYPTLEKLYNDAPQDIKEEFTMEEFSLELFVCV